MIIDGAKFQRRQERTGLDTQIGYGSQSGPLTSFSILLQAKNPTDQPFFPSIDSDESVLN